MWISLILKQSYFPTHSSVHPLVRKVLVIKLVLLGDVVLGELGQLHHLLVVAVGDVDQRGHDSVGNNLCSVFPSSIRARIAASSSASFSLTSASMVKNDNPSAAHRRKSKSF